MNGHEQVKARDLRIATLIDQWEHSGNKARVRCARQLIDAWKADDVLGGFVQVLNNGKHRSELEELRSLVRVVETVDFGGYTQRDADAVAVILFACGYRRATLYQYAVVEPDESTMTRRDRQLATWMDTAEPDEFDEYRQQKIQIYARHHPHARLVRRRVGEWEEIEQ